MLKRLAAIGLTFAGVLLAITAVASAETKDTPKATRVAQTSATPTPRPKAFTYRGYYRMYYFTRQNASNNPGVQFNFSPGAKYNSNAVNQASFNQGVQLHADYHFMSDVTGNGGWGVGAGYFYGNPFQFNECASATSNGKGSPCITNRPPLTNPDNTLPGFIISTLDEAYVSYNANGVTGKLGEQMMNTPWANPDLSRLKADFFTGGDVAYALPSGLNFEAADMYNFQARGAATFTQQTLITGYPAGGGGLASNIYSPGGTGINTAGFFMGKVGYMTPASFAGNPWQADGYLYSVSNIVNTYWGDAKYTWNDVKLKPWVALQGGWESNAGTSVVGKIDSQLAGIQGGVNVTKNVQFWAAYDDIPWHNDTVGLPKGVTCSNSNNQISTTPGTSFKYFLPIDAGQCYTNKNGLTNVYYGGWASPYTDNWATDPVFTTSMTQGMVDRRAPGSSEKIAAIFNSNNHRVTFLVSDAWYNYGNALAGQNTSEYNIDGTYRFSKWDGHERYRGLMLRQRIGNRSLSSTYYPTGSADLGGLPLFKYSRSQVEYDF